MLSILHGTTGAFLASAMPQAPYLYIPLAIASHFIEDAVPHYDAGTGMKSGRRKKIVASVWGIIDLVAMVALIFFIWQKEIPRSWNEINWPIWIGALSGILIDLLEVPNSFFNLKPKILRPIMKLHEKCHVSLNSPFWGLLPQALVLVALIYLAIDIQTANALIATLP